MREIQGLMQRTQSVERFLSPLNQILTLPEPLTTEIGHVAARSAALWFYLQSGKRTSTSMPYWDEHSFDMQRFFNIMCLLYGNAPSSYAELMRQLEIPTNRLQRCSGEYARAYENWMQLLQPYVRGF